MKPRVRDMEGGECSALPRDELGSAADGEAAVPAGPALGKHSSSVTKHRHSGLLEGCFLSSSLKYLQRSFALEIHPSIFLYLLHGRQVFS